MGNIRELSSELINKIAAGEVIERPASVVKELVENALDAGATHVHVTVTDGGKSSIKISDNGHGMTKEDLRLCIKKHATSKIATDEDLFAISTLGFRGEALATVAAVSHLSMTSKTKDDLEATKIIVEDGKILREETVGAPQGTTILVEDLFYNTPARKKYMKDTAVEFRHIVDVMQRHALIHPHVVFRLTHQEKDILHLPASEDKLAKIIALYGKDFAKELIPFNQLADNVKIVGHIGKPHLNRSDKSYIMTFVNGRFIKNKVLTEAIMDAYEHTLNTNRYPVAILNFDIPAERLDVNVHPTKIDIRIEDDDMLYKAARRVIKEALESNDLVPTLTGDSLMKAKDAAKHDQHELYKHAASSYADMNNSASSIAPRVADGGIGWQAPLESQSQSQSSAAAQNNGDLPSTNISSILANPQFSKQIREDLKNRPQDRQQVSQETLAAARPNATDMPAQSENSVLETMPKHASTPSFKVLGMVHKTYIILETIKGLRLVDMHVAFERILFEKFMKQFAHSALQTQTLIEAVLVDVSTDEQVLIEEHPEYFAKFGFTVESFGPNKVALRSVPSILGKTQSDLLFEVIVSELKEGKERAVDEIIREYITMKSCRASPKAGDYFENAQIEKTIKELMQCDQPHFCPHGRPIIVDLTMQELSKIFNRTRGYETTA